MMPLFLWGHSIQNTMWLLFVELQSNQCSSHFCSAGPSSAHGAWCHTDYLALTCTSTGGRGDLTVTYAQTQKKWEQLSLECRQSNVKIRCSSKVGTHIYPRLFVSPLRPTSTEQACGVCLSFNFFFYRLVFFVFLLTDFQSFGLPDDWKSVKMTLNWVASMQRTEPKTVLNVKQIN